MSSKKQYKCIGCGYSVDIYEGRGLFQQEIVPMLCSECHTIQNIVVGGIIGDVAPSYRSEAGRLCLRCGSPNINHWNGHTCPKCGADMKYTGKNAFWT